MRYVKTHKKLNSFMIVFCDISNKSKPTQQLHNNLLDSSIEGSMEYWLFGMNNGCNYFNQKEVPHYHTIKREVRETSSNSR